jgi:hypothetical protein
VSIMEKCHRKNMFGGICRLLNRNVFFGVSQDFLILRLGGENTEEDFP